MHEQQIINRPMCFVTLNFRLHVISRPLNSPNVLKNRQLFVLQLAKIDVIRVITQHRSKIN